jgi:hypothetical protein
MRAFTAIDAALAAAMICGAIAAFAATGSVRPDRVVVWRQNTVVAEYPLKNNISFTVNGKNGEVGIEIKNGAANISHATCPKGICKLSSPISAPNAQLICAPNHIMIQIQSAGGGKNGGGEVDVITY